MCGARRPDEAAMDEQTDEIERVGPTWPIHAAADS